MNILKKIAMLAMLTSVAGFSQAYVETWYTYWAVGGSSNTYPADLQKVVDDKPADVFRIQSSGDFFGFYWPLANEKTILGFVGNSSSDMFTDGYNDVQFIQSALAVSTMHFFGSEPGDGLYIRADVGTASLSVNQSGYSAGTTESGLGVLGGIGYGAKITEETRILLGVSYARNYIPTTTGETFDSVRFTVGGLW